jgi:hypothetical protein
MPIRHAMPAFADMLFAVAALSSAFVLAKGVDRRRVVRLPGEQRKLILFAEFEKRPSRCVTEHLRARVQQRLITPIKRIFCFTRHKY